MCLVWFTLHGRLTLFLLFFFFQYRPDHRNLHSFPTRRSSDLNRIKLLEEILSFRMQGVEFDNGDMYELNALHRSEERFSRNAETDLVCRLLLEKKNRPARRVADRALSLPPAAAESAGSRVFTE